jgi:hypothetical protein
MDDRRLTFRLSGINNQNFIMRDEETGSWWQQVTGEAILGPLKGRKLELLPHDEIAFGTWKRERAGGRVLRPDPEIAAAQQYAPANWAERVGRYPAPIRAGQSDELAPRSLIAGIQIGGESRAYVLESLKDQRVVNDIVAGTPVLIVIGDDGKSVRGFERKLEGRVLSFKLKDPIGGGRLIDAETSSEWDFTGTAISGQLSGKRLPRVFVLKDFWFDWKAYNPATSVYPAD